MGHVMSMTGIGTASGSIMQTEVSSGGFMMRKGTWSNRSCRNLTTARWTMGRDMFMPMIRWGGLFQ